MPQRPSVRLIYKNPVFYEGLGVAYLMSVDGVEVAPGDEVLRVDNPPLNGPYVVTEQDDPRGIIRRADWNRFEKVKVDDWWFVEEGSEQGASWGLFGFNGPYSGVMDNADDPIVIYKKDIGRAVMAGEGMQLVDTGDGPKFKQAPTGVEEGPYTLISGALGSDGRFTSAETSQLGLGYIEGMNIMRDSSLSVKVAAGAAYVPGLGRVVEIPDAVIVPLLTGHSQKFLYLYLTEINRVPQLFLSTIRPELVPFAGSARHMGIDAAISAGFVGSFNRLVGTVKVLNAVTGPGVNIPAPPVDSVSIVLGGGMLMVRIIEATTTSGTGKYRIVNNGTSIEAMQNLYNLGIDATLFDDFGPLNLMPETAVGVILRVDTNAVASSVGSLETIMFPSTPAMYIGPSTNGVELHIPLNELQDQNFAQLIGYSNEGAGGATTIDLVGYYEQR